MADATICGHAWINSDAHCLHCNADLSVEVAAAVDSLNAAIQQTLGASPLGSRVLQQTSSPGLCP